MKCLNRLDMQLYIDNELSIEQKIEYDNHINTCLSCQELLNEANEEKQMLLSLLSITDNTIFDSEIPVFTIPQKSTKSIRFQLFNIAASIAIIISLYSIFQQKSTIVEPKQCHTQMSTVGNLDNSDQNKKWHKNQLEVVITDENGNIEESFIAEK